MIKKTFRLIHDLRLLFFSFILVSFLYHLGLNPINIGKYYTAKVGHAIGMNVSVPENPINRIAKDLKVKEGELNQREEALIARESALIGNNSNTERNLLIFVAVGIIALFILIIINFYLDLHRNSKKIRYY